VKQCWEVAPNKKRLGPEGREKWMARMDYCYYHWVG
jgi:hypothetical protein